MKRLIIPAVVLFAIAPVASVATPAPAPALGLHAAATITNADATKGLPVAFEATVTYYRSYDKDLFVQDGNDAIYVHATTPLKLTPGDRVLVRGTTHESFRPYVASSDITVIGHGPLPKAVEPTFDQMIRAEEDCKLVTVRAVIRSADLVPDTRSTMPSTSLRMLVDGGMVDANVDNDDENALKGLLDAEVEITGAISGHFDNKMQLTGLLLHVQSLAGIKILKRAASDPWSLPVTRMDRIITGYHAATTFLSACAFAEPSPTISRARLWCCRTDSRSLWINTDSWNPLHMGDIADAIGFPSVENGFLTLNRSEVRDSLVQAPVDPGPLHLAGSSPSAATMATATSSTWFQSRARWWPRSGRPPRTSMFSSPMATCSPQSCAIPYRWNPSPLPPMKDVPLGSRIRVTGICILADANPFNGEVPFNILIRDFDDVVVVARAAMAQCEPPAADRRILFGLVIALGVRAWYMERRNRRRIGSLAYVEQRRSQDS